MSCYELPQHHFRLRRFAAHQRAEADQLVVATLIDRFWGWK